MILAYSETLRDTPDIDEATRHRFLEHIYSSSNRLNNLINDIIELHKLESVGGGFTVDSATPLYEIAEDIKSFYAESTSKT